MRRILAALTAVLTSTALLGAAAPGHLADQPPPPEGTKRSAAGPGVVYPLLSNDPQINKNDLLGDHRIINGDVIKSNWDIQPGPDGKPGVRKLDYDFAGGGGWYYGEKLWGGDGGNVYLDRDDFFRGVKGQGDEKVTLDRIRLKIKPMGPAGKKVELFIGLQDQAGKKAWHVEKFPAGDTWQTVELPLDFTNRTVWNSGSPGDVDPHKLVDFLINEDPAGDGGTEMSKGTILVDDIEFVDTDGTPEDFATASDDRILELAEKRAFQYFIDYYHEPSGLWQSETTKLWQINISATGYGLSAMAIGEQRGWITRQEALARVKNTLRKLYDGQTAGADQEESLDQNGYRGLYWHWTNSERKRAFGELSTVDSGFLLMGVQHIREYYRDDPEVLDLATKIIERVDWDWMTDKRPGKVPFQFFSWYPDSHCREKIKPEDQIPAKGGKGCHQDEHWDRPTDEGFVVQLQAGGSTTHPAPTDAWFKWSRERRSYKGIELVPTFEGSMFAYMFTHGWIDFKRLGKETLPGQQDMAVDWAENTGLAAKAARQFAIDQNQLLPNIMTEYGPDAWGRSDADGPPADPDDKPKNGSYRVYGSPPLRGGHFHSDNTLQPHAAGSVVPFYPAESIRAVRHFMQVPKVWHPRLGLNYSYTTKALSADELGEAYRKNMKPGTSAADAAEDEAFERANGADFPGLPWYSRKLSGMSQGGMLFAIDNYRGGTTQRDTMRSPDLRRAICAPWPNDVICKDSDLEVKVTPAGPEVETGKPHKVTVTVTNKGPDAAVDAVVAITPGPGLTLTGPAADWKIPSLAAGQTLTREIEVTGSAPGDVKVDAAVKSVETIDKVAANDKASGPFKVVDTAVEPVKKSDVEVSVASPGDATTGKPHKVTVTLTNHGPDPAKDAVVTITPGTGLTPGGDVEWKIPALAVGESVTHEIEVTPAQAGRGKIDASVTSLGTTDDVPGNDKGSAAFAVKDLPPPPKKSDLEVRATAADGTATTGRPHKVTLTLTNHGPDAAQDAVVTIAPGSGLTVAGGTEWKVPALAVGESVTQEIEVTPSKAGEQQLGATVASAQTDPVPANDKGDVTFRAQDAPPPVQKSDVEVKVTAPAGGAEPGKPVKVTVTFTNHGPDAAKDAVVKINPGAGLDPAGDVEWKIPALAVGQNVTREVEVTPSASGPATVAAQLASLGTVDDVPGNDRGSVTFAVKDVPPPVKKSDVEVTVASVSGTTETGKPHTVRVTFTNHGPDAATDAVVRIVPGPGLTPAAGVDWRVPALAAGQSVTRDVEVTPNSAGEKTVDASVASLGTVDPVPGNDRGSIAFQVKDVPPPVQNSDVELKVTAAGEATAGTPHKVLVTFTNHGPDPAADAVVKINPGAGLAPAGEIEWKVPALAVGQSVTREVEVTGSAEGEGTVTASLGSLGTVDPTPGNDTGTVTFRVKNPVVVVPPAVKKADVRVTMRAERTSVAVGERVRVTVTAANKGPAEADDVSVTIAPGAGLTLVAGRAAASQKWAVGDLPVGRSASRVYVTTAARIGRASVGAAITARNVDTPGPVDDDRASVVLDVRKAPVLPVKPVQPVKPGKPTGAGHKPGHGYGHGYGHKPGQGRPGPQAQVQYLQPVSGNAPATGTLAAGGLGGDPALWAVGALLCFGFGATALRLASGRGGGRHKRR
ncbi:CARDB domain-containing protein [Streptomyces sp. NPDC087440]|uniref:CARDB domain-containing protein n=1 Tax=Streptomyces sp. NPDC087440 TaxID=3365790 RepID=UPI00380D21E1